MKPNKDLAVDCYVDADFAGLYNIKDDQDPICSKSRSGHVLLFADCPLSWTSKLQRETALSTMESEYIALSLAMRELLPIRGLAQSLLKVLCPGSEATCRTFSKVFEDNNGAKKMAEVPKITLRNRHFAVKYHFFRSHVANGDIQMIKVESERQMADIFTKGLVREIFERVRSLLMGW